MTFSSLHFVIWLFSHARGRRTVNRQMDLKIKGYAPTFFTRVAFGDCRASAGFYNLKSY
ncbi:MAG: hypothetical protein U5M51_14375 [Emticicia sp.]|nr:hypothetical protein [Emticicia sp.]